MSERIGFVGLGQMGQPMALNLMHAGFELRVFDLREERLTPLVARGAERGASPEDVTEPGGIVLSMGLKDIELILQAAEHADVPLPYARVVYEHLLAAKAGGRSHEDWSVLADFVTQAVTKRAISASIGTAQRR